MTDINVRRVDFGYFIRPAAETGTGAARVEAVLGYLIDTPGATYVELDEETEILPGVTIIPTPGHTAGHQSVVVRRGDGTVIVAGQSHDHASDFSADALATRAGEAGAPRWMARLLSFDPARIVFAHDNAVWIP